jgi:hypothetical protein
MFPCKKTLQVINHSNEAKYMFKFLKINIFTDVWVTAECKMRVMFRYRHNKKKEACYDAIMKHRKMKNSEYD